jgi:uncharacterized Rossmann fold enzyme
VSREVVETVGMEEVAVVGAQVGYRECTRVLVQLGVVAEGYTLEALGRVDTEAEVEVTREQEAVGAVPVA